MRSAATPARCWRITRFPNGCIYSRCCRRARRARYSARRCRRRSPMSHIDRRDFVRALTAAGVAAGTPHLGAQAPVSAEAVAARNTAAAPPLPAPPPPVTRILAKYVVEARGEYLPQAVRDEAARTLLN